MSKYFKIFELMPPELEPWGEFAWAFIDDRIVIAADLFRAKVDRPVLINTWKWGGAYKESGLRMPNTTTGGKLSQHKFGRALDLKVEGLSSFEMAEIVQRNEKEFMRIGLTTIEAPEHTHGKFKDWLHIDCRHTGLDKIKIVRP